MARLNSFMTISINGYYADEKNSMEFAHRKDAKPDPEFAEWTANNVQGGGRLLFGRTTYDLMKQYWPTPQAKKDLPEVADGMNRAQKLVASKTMSEPGWANTTVIKDNLASEIAKLKKDGPDITILGSGTIVQQLADAGLIDQISVVIAPVSLKGGKSFLAGTEGLRTWKVAESRAFKNGNLFVRYQPA
ncbi:MAG TPA: dihydrofolate reductase family protein [Hyphomonadaceae bacterium]|jgi:dihydrofolate reductase|nr:dihydrofolate reductase family protein [Hyphomonadaceae bacterium]